MRAAALGVLVFGVPALANDAGISFVGASEGVADGGLTSLTIDAPAGLLDGDLLVAGLSIDSQMGSQPASPGWVPLEQQTRNYPPEYRRWAIFFRPALAEPARWTWTWTGAADEKGATAVVAAFRGVDPVYPIADFQGGAGDSIPMLPVRIPPGAEHVIVGLADLPADAGGLWLPPPLIVPCSTGCGWRCSTFLAPTAATLEETSSTAPAFRRPSSRSSRSSSLRAASMGAWRCARSQRTRAASPSTAPR
jgi:hypothetical protein